MKSIWKGAVQLGLLIIPCKLYNVSTTKDNVKFHMMSNCCSSRVKLQKKCGSCNNEVTETKKGYPLSKDKIVIFDDEELKQFEQNKSNIEIQSFISQEDIDSLLFDDNYYVVPEELGLKPYSLLSNTLHDKYAFVQFIMHGKQRMGILRSVNNNLILTSLHYPHEMNPALDIKKLECSPTEIKLMNQIVKQFSSPLDISTYTDTYKELIEDLAKQKEQGISITNIQPTFTPKDDLVEALQKMLGG